jgi:hypothetical protein
MPDFVISEFGGLNTKKEDPSNGIVLPTKVAKNVDLRNGVLKPFAIDKAIESGHVGEITVFGGQTISGKQNYVNMVINGFNILVYKDSGKWKRAVKKPTGAVNTAYPVVDLSQPTPSAPTVQILPNDPTKVRAESAPSGWFYEAGYVITFVRDSDGYRDESAPSPIISAQNQDLAFRVRRPSVSGGGVVAWVIYRISTGYRATSSFQKVAEVAIGEDYYDDYLLGSELNGTFSGIFTEDGATVLRQPAPVQFDGVSSKLFYGQLVGWKNETVYISEPAQPESFPAQYQIFCNDKVIAVESFSGDLYAFTDSGIQRILGDNPITMAILPDYIGHRAVNRRAVITTEAGLFYAYKTGIGRIASDGHSSISRNLLGDDYFKNINMDTVHLNYADGILYVFHSKGTLLFVEELGIGFVEITSIYEGSHYDRKNGQMMVTGSNWAWAVHQGTESRTLQYRQDGLVLNQPEDKRFEMIRVYGNGKFNVKLFLDGVVRSERILNLDGMLRDRTIKFPYGYPAREASWEITGTGKITEIRALLGFD